MRAVKRIALWRYTIDLAFTRAVLRCFGEPRFRLAGRCHACGGCCDTPMIQVFPPLFYFRSVRWLLKWWHSRVNGFEYISEDRQAKALIFRCTHWDPATKRCDSYATRPGLCRDYPRNLLYTPNPEFLDGCGFCAVDKDAQSMREALAELDLPPEKLAELERKLHVHQGEKEV